MGFFTDIAQQYTKMQNDALANTGSANNQIGNALINNLYNSLAHVETGGEEDPYIRTKVLGSGSSAYGPLQMTGGSGSMMANIYNNPQLALKMGINPSELTYIGNYLDQGQKFLDYGGGDWERLVDEGALSMEEGLMMRDKYEYGKAGDLGGADNRALYEQVSKKILDYEFHEQAGGDPEKFIRNWHHGANATDEEWAKYRNSPAGSQYVNNFLSQFQMPSS